MRMLVWVLMKHTKPKGFDVPANWRKHGLTDYELTPLAKKYPEQLYKALWKRWGTQGLGFSRDPSDREDACFEETGELSPLVNVVLACFLIVEERGEWNVTLSACAQVGGGKFCYAESFKSLCCLRFGRYTALF